MREFLRPNDGVFAGIKKTFVGTDLFEIECSFNDDLIECKECLRGLFNRGGDLSFFSSSLWFSNKSTRSIFRSRENTDLSLRNLLLCLSDPSVSVAPANCLLLMSLLLIVSVKRMYCVYIHCNGITLN